MNLFSIFNSSDFNFFLFELKFSISSKLRLTYHAFPRITINLKAFSHFLQNWNIILIQASFEFV